MEGILAYDRLVGHAMVDDGTDAGIVAFEG